jgi:short chain dehydrogenase
MFARVSATISTERRGAGLSQSSASNRVRSGFDPSQQPASTSYGVRMPGYFDLSNRVALVTGASRGLGLAMAEALAEVGATVILNGRDANTLKTAADRMRGRGLGRNFGVRRYRPSRYRCRNTISCCRSSSFGHFDRQCRHNPSRAPC